MPITVSFNTREEGMMIKQKDKKKMIKVISKGFVFTSRGRVRTPIVKPYKESVKVILDMISRDNATVVEVLPNGEEVPLTIFNFSEDIKPTENKEVQEKHIEIIDKPKTQNLSRKKRRELERKQREEAEKNKMSNSVEEKIAPEESVTDNTTETDNEVMTTADNNMTDEHSPETSDNEIASNNDNTTDYESDSTTIADSPTDMPEDAISY